MTVVVLKTLLQFSVDENGLGLKGKVLGHTLVLRVAAKHSVTMASILIIKLRTVAILRVKSLVSPWF